MNNLFISSYSEILGYVTATVQLDGRTYSVQSTEPETNRVRVWHIYQEGKRGRVKPWLSDARAIVKALEIQMQLDRADFERESCSNGQGE
jgi:hypothetical protein